MVLPFFRRWCYHFLGKSKSQRVSKLQYWFKSYGDFAEWGDFAYWWNCIGIREGSARSLRSRLVSSQTASLAVGAPAALAWRPIVVALSLYLSLYLSTFISLQLYLASNRHRASLADFCQQLKSRHIFSSLAQPQPPAGEDCSRRRWGRLPVLHHGLLVIYTALSCRLFQLHISALHATLHLVALPKKL